MRKFKRAVTDSDSRIVMDPVGKPGVSNLIQIYAVATGKSIAEVEAEFAGKDELAAFLEREVQEGDCLLFKGSNSMGVSVLAERFKKLAGLSEG